MDFLLNVCWYYVIVRRAGRKTVGEMKCINLTHDIDSSSLMQVGLENPDRN